MKTLEMSIIPSYRTLNLNILLCYSISTFPWLINSWINSSFDKQIMIRSIYFSVSVQKFIDFLYSYLDSFRLKIDELRPNPLKGDLL